MNALFTSSGLFFLIKGVLNFKTYCPSTFLNPLSLLISHISLSLSLFLGGAQDIVIGVCNWLMDIDLLWSFGGWFLIIYSDTINYCMANLRSTSHISKFSNPNSCSSLVLIALLIIIFLITSTQSSTSMAVASHPSEPTTSSHDHESPKSSTTTMNFHRKRTHDHQAHPKPTRSFEAGAHEVPSGPNPISNR